MLTFEYFINNLKVYFQDDPDELELMLTRAFDVESRMLIAEGKVRDAKL